MDLHAFFLHPWTDKDPAQHCPVICIKYSFVVNSIAWPKGQIHHRSPPKTHKNPWLPVSISHSKPINPMKTIPPINMACTTPWQGWVYLRWAGLNACKIIHQNVNRIWRHPHVDRIWNFQKITKMGIITTISDSIYFRMIIYVHTYIIIYTYLYILLYIYIYLMVYIVCLFSKQKETSLWFPVPWVPFLPQGPRARGCSGFPDLPFLAEGAVPKAHDQGGRRNPKGWYLGCSACGLISLCLSLPLSLSLFMYIYIYICMYESVYN